MHKTPITPNDYMVKLDLKDAYLTLGVIHTLKISFDLFGKDKFITFKLYRSDLTQPHAYLQNY